MRSKPKPAKRYDLKNYYRALKKESHPVTSTPMVFSRSKKIITEPVASDSRGAPQRTRAVEASKQGNRLQIHEVRRHRTKIEKEIRKFQRSTDLLVPRSTFARLIREIVQDLGCHDMRFQLVGLIALQEAAEAFLVRLFEHANWCALHAKRVTLMKQDMQLVEKISSFKKFEGRF